MDKRKFGTEEARAVGTILGIDWAKVDLEEFRRGLEVELQLDKMETEADEYWSTRR